MPSRGANHVVPRLALPFITFILAIFAVISRSIYHILTATILPFTCNALGVEDYNA